MGCSRGRLSTEHQTGPVKILAAEDNSAVLNVQSCALVSILARGDARICSSFYPMLRGMLVTVVSPIEIAPTS
jgi:hypothetical protein